MIGQFICTMAFAAACWAAGDFLCNRLSSKKGLTPLARHTLAFAAGNVVFSYLLTLLGFVGLFTPSILWLVFLFGIAYAIWHLGAELRPTFRSGLVKELAQVWKTGEDKFAVIFLLGTTGLFLLFAILQAAAPPNLRDSLVYHLLCPKEYLEAERIIHISGNIFSAFPKGHEVLMTLLLSVSGDRAAQSFSILQQIAAISSLYSLVRLVAGSWPSVLCTIGFATVPPIIYFTGCGYVEPALLMTLGSSLLSLSLFLKLPRITEDDGSNCLKEIGMVGLLSGWMVALKYNGLIYVGLIGLILLWKQRKAPFKEAIRVSGIFALGAAPGLCWMIWNWATLGNPVYPMAWFLFGGKGWDEARAFAMSLYFDQYGMGRSLSDYLLLPWRLAFSGRFDTLLFDGAMGPFLLIFLILTLVSFLPQIRHRWIPSNNSEMRFMLIISSAFFLFGTQQARFWLPSQMLACASAAPAVELLVRWARKNPWIKSVLILLVTVSLIWNLGFLMKQTIAVGYYRPVLGLEQERAFLIRKVPGYPAIEFINQKLPDRARVFCVWTGAYGYYFHRSYYSDTFIEDATLKRFIDGSPDGSSLAKKLLEAGFTHLYLKVPLLEKNLKPEQQLIFYDFLRKSTRVLFRFHDFYVLAITER